MDNVCDKLEQLLLEKHVSAFRKFNVDGKKLMKLSKNYFENELEMSVRDRKIVKKLVDLEKMMLAEEEKFDRKMSMYDNEASFTNKSIRSKPCPPEKDYCMFTNTQVFYVTELGNSNSGDIFDAEELYIQSSENYKLLYSELFLKSDHRVHLCSKTVVNGNISTDEVYVVAEEKLSAGEGLFVHQNFLLESLFFPF